MYSDSPRNIELQIEMFSRTNVVYAIITVRFCGNLLLPGGVKAKIKVWKMKYVYM